MNKYKLICMGIRRYNRRKKILYGIKKLQQVSLHINDNVQIDIGHSGNLYLSGFNVVSFSKLDKNKYSINIYNKFYHIDEKKVNLSAFATTYKSIVLYKYKYIKQNFCDNNIIKLFNKNNTIIKLSSVPLLEEDDEYIFNI